ncbi:MAG: hypothetical protein QOH13_1598 [Thermoleophilaceae bacterium]|jgi:uncharacterized repeat protein (TIGR01451 family)|nr:hypothetical protein [Thermoleophilaceae bacterium]
MPRLTTARLARLFVLPALALAFLSSTAVASADTTADLSIGNPTISGDPYVGSTATYTMQVGNNGPDATEATVTDQLGDSEELVSASASQGSCTQAAPATCSLGTLGPAASASVTIQVKYTKTSNNQHSDAISGPSTNVDPDMNNNFGGAGFQVTEPEAPAPAQAPTAETGSWSRSQARLDVDGLVTFSGTGTYYFEYGKTKAYGDKTSAKKAGGGDGVTVKARLAGLAMDTTYHYRLVLVVGGKTYRGRDKSARTLGKLKYGPLTLKVVSRAPSSAVYTGRLGAGLADAPGACKGTVTVEVYTTGGADILAKKTIMRSDCTYKVTVPFGATQARKYGPKGNVIVQARFSGNRAVSSVGSGIDNP